MNKPPFIGLEVRSIVKHGQPATFHEMAIWCQAGAEVLHDPTQKVSWQRLQQIYEKTLRKIRAKLYRDVMTNEELRDAFYALSKK